MNYRLLIVFLLFFSKLFFGQNISPKDLDFHFAKDSILLQPGKVVDNTIVIKNNTTSPVKIDSIKARENYPGLLFSPSFSETIQSGEGQELKVRLVASKDLLVSKITKFDYKIFYTFNGKQTIENISFSVQREKMDFVSIFPMGELFYNPTGQENLLRFFVENQSYQPKVVRVKLKLMPSEFVSVFPEEQVIQLNSKEKQLVTVSLKKRQNITYSPDYNLSINVVEDSNNASLSSVVLPIRSLSSYRMINYEGNYLQSKNFVEASYNNTNDENQFYKFRTNLEKKIDNQTSIGFTSTTDYYSENNLTNIYDTRLDVNYKNWYAGIGNVYGQDYDFNVNGRGLKVASKINENNKVEVFGLDNNYMLYSSYGNNFSYGKTAGMQYSYFNPKNKNKQLYSKSQVSYLYNQNNFNKVDTHLANFKLPLYSDSLQIVTFEGGVSQEHLDSQQFNFNKNGMASGVNYTYFTKKLSFNSNNYYSTPYYSGIRRGAFNLDEMLNYNLSDNHNFFIRFSNATNRSNYLSDALPFGFTENGKYINQIAELGWSWNKKNYRLSIAPNYTYQYINSIYNQIAYTAYRTRITFGKSYNAHQINLSWDGGLSVFNNNFGNIFAQRITFNYAYKIINFSMMADINPTNAYDLNWYNGGQFINYSSSLGTRINLLNNRLNGYFNLGYSYMNTQKTNNIYVNANLDYKLSPSWSLTGMSYYNFYHGNGIDANPSYQYSNFQYKIGLKMSLGNTNNGNKLSLKIYEDENINSKNITNKIAVKDAMVRLNNNIVALTNDKGMVKFINLKDGEYNISVTKNNQRIPLLGLEKINVTKNSKLEIPIVKTITLEGDLEEIKDKYDAQVADFMGINIYAEDLVTGKVFVTVTDIKGNFNFQLVEGTYKIYIKNDRYEILNNSQTAELKNSQKPNKIIFNFKNKELKIRRKQF
ncbi:MAG: TonB-dependent receptor [Bacteroidetes bacterium]|nr:TonB-dependent receptor [Bacteroidota bacterium]